MKDLNRKMTMAMSLVFSLGMMASVSADANQCNTVFAQPTRTFRADVLARALDRLNNKDYAVPHAAPAIAAQPSLDAIKRELSRVQSVQDWKNTSIEAKIEFMQWNSGELKINRHSSSAGMKTDIIHGFADFVLIEKVNNSADREFATAMLDFMKKESDLSAMNPRMADMVPLGNAKIFVEVLRFDSGEVLGGRILIKQNVVYQGELPTAQRKSSYESIEEAKALGLEISAENYDASGYFDGNMSPLRFDEVMKYNH